MATYKFYVDVENDHNYDILENEYILNYFETYYKSLSYFKNAIKTYDCGVALGIEKDNKYICELLHSTKNGFKIIEDYKKSYVFRSDENIINIVNQLKQYNDMNTINKI